MKCVSRGILGCLLFVSMSFCVEIGQVGGDFGLGVARGRTALQGYGVLDVNLTNKFVFETGIGYKQRGCTFEYGYFEDVDGDDLENLVTMTGTAEIDYLAIPLAFKYYFGNPEKAALFILAKGEIGLPVVTRYKLDEVSWDEEDVTYLYETDGDIEQANIDFSSDVGLGLSIPIGAIFLNILAGMEFGATSMSDEAGSPYEGEKNGALYSVIGIHIPLHKQQ